MIGLDTNVIVRYLAQDDPTQAPIATTFIETRLTVDNPGFVSIVAMAETVWVLERAYHLADADIAAAIESMLSTEVLVIEHEQAVFTAMVAVQEGLGSFADALVVALGADAGCSKTVSFDRKATRIPGFELLAHP